MYMFTSMSFSWLLLSNSYFNVQNYLLVLARSFSIKVFSLLLMSRPTHFYQRKKMLWGYQPWKDRFPHASFLFVICVSSSYFNIINYLLVRFSVSITFFYSLVFNACNIQVLVLSSHSLHRPTLDYAARSQFAVRTLKLKLTLLKTTYWNVLT